MPKATKESTADVMKRAEQGQVKAPERRKLRVIGLPDEGPSWEEARNGFDLKAFPTGYVSPQLTAQSVDSALKSAYSNLWSSAPEDYLSKRLDNLNERFEFTKSVVQHLGVAIPDAVVSQLQTVGDIQAYFVDRVVGKKFNEKEPDAVYFDPAEFEGLNVRFEDAKEEKTREVKKWKELVRQAKEHDRLERARLMEEAAKSD